MELLLLLYVVPDNYSRRILLILGTACLLVLYLFFHLRVKTFHTCVAQLANSCSALQRYFYEEKTDLVLHLVLCSVVFAHSLSKLVSL